VPSEPFSHLDGYGAAMVTRMGTRRSCRLCPYLYVSQHIGLLPHRRIIISAGDGPEDVVTRKDAGAVVDHQRLSKILLQLCARLLIDTKERQLRVEVPTNDDVVNDRAAIELTYPDPGAAGVHDQVACDSNIRIRCRIREEARVIRRL
jgi:hypothetical protein